MRLDLSKMLIYENESKRVLGSLRSGIIEIILIELESLPKSEWKRALTTWAKVFLFAEKLEGRSLEGLDVMSIGILQSIAEKIKEAKSFGILKEGDKPFRLVVLALENEEKTRDSAVYFIWDFFRRIS